ncbi:MAG TPA: MBOAT family O-acyltransferase [Gemmataceae bacterium]|nr:MBOAT family O-acyltransferase [Gemmataceae bacterium]
MLFNSPIFLFLFLPLVLGVYFLAPASWRNAVLLFASLLFYAWGEKFYVLLMITSIAANYGFGLWLEAWKGKQTEAALLAFAILFNLSLLVSCKYASFLADNLNVLLVWFGAAPVRLKPVHLPIGISFFTFEALAYLIDIRRGKTAAARNPINFGLFMTLFPHLIAGPVVRYRDLAAALERRTVSREQAASGIRRFILGLAKKMLLANTFAQVAAAMFRLPPAELSASAAWLGLVCYTLQIYFDFSGYSDMAIGLGRLFGFELNENFNYPYTARSVTDFWRRWHMSLSAWFRDYLYIPLGGNRHGPAHTYLNLMLVFMFCGLWHGASWTFLAWGVFHGFFLVLERLGWGRMLEWLPRIMQHLLTLAIVMVGWVFFEAKSLSHAGGYLSALIGLHGEYVWHDFWSRELALALAVGLIACCPVWPALQRGWQRGHEQAPGWRRAALAAAGEFASLSGLSLLFVASVLQLAAGTYNPFIYYRF